MIHSSIKPSWHARVLWRNVTDVRVIQMFRQQEITQYRNFPRHVRRKEFLYLLIYFAQKKSSSKSFRKHRASIASTSPKEWINHFYNNEFLIMTFSRYVRIDDSSAIPLRTVVYGFLFQRESLNEYAKHWITSCTEIALRRTINHPAWIAFSWYCSIFITQFGAYWNRFNAF